MDESFITLHRKILKSACFDDAELFKLWVWCLLRANYKDREVVHAGQVVKLERGQFITGRFMAIKELNLSVKKYRTRIELLEKMGQISLKTANKYTIITVVNYDYYQTKEEKGANKRPTKGQQKATDNNINNINNNTPPSGEENMNWKSNQYGEDYLEEDLQVDPDFKPKKKKSVKKVSDDVQAVFDLFENPASALWRMREIERVAAQTLFDTYGLETLKRRIKRIKSEQKTADQFFPVAVTPSQLLDKMPNIERYLGI